MNRLIKKKRGGIAHKSETENITVRACLLGLGVFFAVGLTSTLVITALAYSQKDPSAYLYLGRICPYLAAVSAGAMSGKATGGRPWLTGGLIGLLSSVLLWLFSAGFSRNTSSGTSLLMHLGVVVASVLGGVVFGRVKHFRHRRAGHHRRA
jgi:putative membrane protein (TIGR04086 family)